MADEEVFQRHAGAIVAASQSIVDVAPHVAAIRFVFGKVDDALLGEKELIAKEGLLAICDIFEVALRQMTYVKQVMGDVVEVAVG
jgi:hypothetical protein